MDDFRDCIGWQSDGPDPHVPDLDPSRVLLPASQRGALAKRVSPQNPCVSGGSQKPVPFRESAVELVFLGGEQVLEDQDLTLVAHRIAQLYTLGHLFVVLSSGASSVPSFLDVPLPSFHPSIGCTSSITFLGGKHFPSFITFIHFPVMFITTWLHCLYSPIRLSKWLVPHNKLQVFGPKRTEAFLS